MGLATLVRESREKEDLSQEELARAIGVSKGMIQHIESGRRQPSMAVLQLLDMRFGWGLPWTSKPQGVTSNRWFIQTLSDLLEHARDSIAV